MEERLENTETWVGMLLQREVSNSFRTGTEQWLKIHHQADHSTSFGHHMQICQNA